MFQNLIKNHSDKIRFVIVGTANTTIDFALLFGLVNFLSIPIFFSNIISTSVALSFSFFANKKFTFKDNSQNAKRQLIRFLMVTLLGLWIIQPIIIAITDMVFFRSIDADNIMLLSGKLMASCVTLVWNYLLYRKFVFNNKKGE